jgi:acetylornithine deacetylase/succinyl-diaminopimelate desuccinylase-like protein
MTGTNVAKPLAAGALLAALLVGVPMTALAAPAIKVDAKQSAAALEMYKTSIGYRTVQGQGQIPAYATYLKKALIEGGFADADVTIEKMGETATLTARYRGNGSKKPMLLSGHMDVVEAKAADWVRDPFTAVVENGYVYGRGASDMKFDVVMLVSTLIRLKQEGFKPSRDIVLALSGDEETDMFTSQALSRQLAGAEFAINADAGGGLLDDAGKPVVYQVQAGEKTYADFDITITNPGGHSSRPGATNAIYDLAKIIDRIGAYKFPAQPNALTVGYFKATGAKTPGPIGQAMLAYANNPADTAASDLLSAEPEYIGQVRTTCVATMLRGGHALNALPQAATVLVNCRIMPGVSIATIKSTLETIIANPAATVTVLGEPTASDASPLRPDVMGAIRKAIDRRAPGLPIVPQMSAGATDSLYFRAAGIPSYGLSGMFMNPADDYAHGLNERAPVAAIDGALDQWHKVISILAK